jgi:4-amino-4-deoxy-L-arabinose transferase-like glycosyltransferase
MFAIGVREMWCNRASRFCRFGLAAMILTTGVWSWWILGQNRDWLPALRWTILAVTVVAAIPLLAALISRTHRWAVAACVAVGLLASVAGPAAYAVATIAQPHQGGGPTVGPADPDRGNQHGMWGQQADNPQLDAMLVATHTLWSAAVERSSAAANLELSSNTAVMAIGGFSGNDPAPTLNQFIDDVHNHRITYYVVQQQQGPGRGRPGRVHADIAKWVAANYTPVSVGSATVYNLTDPPRTGA